MTTTTQTPSVYKSSTGLTFIDTLGARFAPLVGRFLIGGMFTYAGVTKIGAYAGTQGFMESVGLPGTLLPLVIAFEIAAGIALITGWHARLVAFLLAGFTLMTALIFHADLADPIQSLLFVKNVAIAGGLLVIAGLGSGPLSLMKTGASDA